MLKLLLRINLFTASSASEERTVGPGYSFSIDESFVNIVGTR